MVDDTRLAAEQLWGPWVRLKRFAFRGANYWTIAARALTSSAMA